MNSFEKIYCCSPINSSPTMVGYLQSKEKRETWVQSFETFCLFILSRVASRASLCKQIASKLQNSLSSGFQIFWDGVLIYAKSQLSTKSILYAVLYPKYTFWGRRGNLTAKFPEKLKSWPESVEICPPVQRIFTGYFRIAPVKERTVKTSTTFSIDQVWNE